MLWVDELLDGVHGPQIVNDSKTPSGPVHVGSLRGVLIHDAIYRALQARKVPARYLYGVDDYDPLDELPAVHGERFRDYLGMPLCNIPAPPDSAARNLAEHYISEFFQVFQALGVGAETYRVSDIYRSQSFDRAIDKILRSSAAVRTIYLEVAGARRDDDWFPFQAICERCGRIGTTKVFAYDGERVSYHCMPGLVRWAEGCGHKATASPFAGGGKLAWKLEWVAKWATLGITIEGAGKDHNTKGGSHDVAVRCLREIFDMDPPLNIPYEFFLVSGAKMSSSKGVGVTAREMAELLPPELLRYLVIRSLPNKPVDFSPNYDKIVRLYDDFDRLRAAVKRPENHDLEDRLYSMAQVDAEADYFAPAFDLLLSLVQMPHLDLDRQSERLKGDRLSALDEKHLRSRVASARCWLSSYAEPSERLELASSLPESVSSLSVVQVEFLHRLSSSFADIAWDADKLQACIFDVARQTPISQGQAFSALYRVLFGRDSGPRAGNVLAFLERRFVVGRLIELPRPQRQAFWLAASLSEDELESWLLNVAGDAVAITSTLLFDGAVNPLADYSASFVSAVGAAEVSVALKDGKHHARRCITLRTQGYSDDLIGEKEYFAHYSRDFIESLSSRIGRPISAHQPVDADGGNYVSPTAPPRC